MAVVKRHREEWYDVRLDRAEAELLIELFQHTAGSTQNSRNGMCQKLQTQLLEAVEDFDWDYAPRDVETGSKILFLER